MNAKELIDSLRAQGATLTLDGEQLRFKAPAAWTKDERDLALLQLRANREDVKVYLVAGERYERPADLAACGSPTCGGCYEVSTGVMLHPPRPGYHYEEHFK